MFDFLIPLAIAFVVILLILIPAFAYAAWWRRTVGPRIWAEFLARTGYRRAQDPGAPLDQQARQILQDILPADGVAKRGPWVRDARGMPVFFQGTIGGSSEVMTFTESWRLKLPAPAPFGLQIIDRAIADPSMLASAGDALVGRSRSFMPRFPRLPATSIPFIDQRFIVFSTDPARAQAALSDTTLQGMMHGLPEVDVLVSGGEIMLNDPSGKIRRQVMGLGVVTPTAMIQREPEVHERPVWLLRHLAWLVTGQ